MNNVLSPTRVFQRLSFLTALLSAVVLAACSQDPAPTPVPIPTSTPVPAESSANQAASSALPNWFDWTKAFPDTDSAPPEAPSGLPGGAHGFSHYVLETVGDQVVTTLVEGPREKQVRVPLSYSQLKELLEGGGPTDEVQMSREELSTLVGQLDTIKESTERYRDVDVALAEGFTKITDEVPNMGAHFVNAARSLDDIFDPSQPEMLLYVADDAGELELVGTAFVLPIPLASPDHPEAFAGPLDNWHVHYNLCTGPGVTSRSATPEACEAAGGIWVPGYGWMIHAWVWNDNPLGVFSMWNTRVPPVAETADIRRARTEDDAFTIAVENFGFTTREIKAGETLTWLNVDGVPHTVTSATKGFDSGPITSGQSFALTFDQPGEHRYTCAIHPFMTSTVTVTP